MYAYAVLSVTVTWMYVFRDDHLALDKHLMCSFLGRTSSLFTISSVAYSFFNVRKGIEKICNYCLKNKITLSPDK